MQETLLIAVLAAFIGASIGSFLTLVTYRLPRDEKIGLSRSRCPACATTLKARDLFPILSWLLSAGKCRYCKTRVSARYPLTELACAIGTVLAMHDYGVSLQAFAIAGLWWCIVAVFVTDLEHYIILDEVQIALIAFGALYHYAIGTAFMDVAIGAVTGLLIGLALKYGFLLLRKKDGLGWGDVKLLFGCGIWLASAISFVPFLFFAGLAGIVFGLLWRISGRGEIFPFGPSLVACLLALTLHPEWMQFFWQLYQR